MRGIEVWAGDWRRALLPGAGQQRVGAFVVAFLLGMGVGVVITIEYDGLSDCLPRLYEQGAFWCWGVA